MAPHEHSETESAFAGQRLPAGGWYGPLRSLHEMYRAGTLLCDIRSDRRPPSGQASRSSNANRNAVLTPRISDHRIARRSQRTMVGSVFAQMVESVIGGSAA